jgi:hypothetical protein
VALPAAARPAARAEFWKREPRQADAAVNGGASRVLDLAADAAPPAAMPGGPVTAGGPGAPPALSSAAGAVELRIELAPHVVLSLVVVDDRVTVSPADVRAIRAAAAPLLAELASRRLASHDGEDR